ncbi:hypothetical protein [Dactylosporangium sp. CA-233914]|uniref:hypothetical protein n=1 Tax=Dactylosporangium sp. CA-233914 TaxID=3239934 RepID=UPI003D8F0A00
MAPIQQQAILVDTSTLTELRLDDPERRPHLDHRGAAAVEALVLFDKVYLDGRTVNAELSAFQWQDELDHGFVMVNNSYDEVQTTYHRGMQLAAHIAATPPTADFLRTSTSPIELERPLRYTPDDQRLWSDLRGYVAHEMSRDTEIFIDRLMRDLDMDQPSGGIILARMCYYLALQEQLGSLLLLHPTKGYAAASSYGYASRILDVFDDRVRHAYQQRYEQWLGQPAQELSTPLLAGYVMRESDRRGWSVGRTISWLRTTAEVSQFRQGMAELMTRIDAQDHIGIDEVLSELERAAELWSAQIGAKLPRRTIALQPAIPFVSPTINIPAPDPIRTPGKKLLVLVERLLR